LRPSRDALAPGLPTLAASGLPGCEVASFLGMFAPAKTPTAVIDRLNQEIVRVVEHSEVKEGFFNTGIDVIGSSPEKLSTTMKAEMARLGKVVREAGIRGQ
jgi:tripartite-type tricarboxylate transporter receptor subunit TctC